MRRESKRENDKMAKCEKKRVGPEERKKRESYEKREKSKVSFYVKKSELRVFW